MTNARTKWTLLYPKHFLLFCLWNIMLVKLVRILKKLSIVFFPKIIEIFWIFSKIAKLHFGLCTKELRVQIEMFCYGKFRTLLNFSLKSSKRLGKIKFVVCGRSNIKIEIWVLQYIPRKHVKYIYWMTMCTLTYQNFAPKFLRYAHFSSFSSEIYQISNFLKAINFCRIER